MSEKQWEKIYDEYRESLEQGPDSVRDAYQEMNEAFEKYLCAIEDWTARTAFQFGFDYAARTETRKAV